MFRIKAETSVSRRRSGGKQCYEYAGGIRNRDSYYSDPLCFCIPLKLLEGLASLIFSSVASVSLHAAGSDYPPHRSEAKLFRIEFSDLHVSKEDSVKPRCNQLESKFLEAKYFADEDPVLVPADVSGVVHSS